MSEFDPIKAMREEIAGLADVHKVIRTHALETEKRLGEIEAERNAFLKMESLMVTLLESARSKLRRLEEKAQEQP